MKGRIRSATASAKKVNTVWVYPDAVSPRGGVDLLRRQFDRAVTQGKLVTKMRHRPSLSIQSDGLKSHL